MRELSRLLAGKANTCGERLERRQRTLDLKPRRADLLGQHLRKLSGVVGAFFEHRIESPARQLDLVRRTHRAREPEQRRTANCRQAQANRFCRASKLVQAGLQLLKATLGVRLVEKDANIRFAGLNCTSTWHRYAPIQNLVWSWSSVVLRAGAMYGRGL